MKKNTIAVLAALLLLSIILNVSLLYKASESEPSKGEVKGAYELFLADTRATQAKS
ncbi:hypothetical protein GCM10010917_33320 [Paenibacillus physcomitrellae]|uniref:Uncharacterized protein n=1 Tax=Paenibacillus physcomitrellae TaxID=1619311 RepID=A0ABQ1GKF1_9BACL|nr:hypothetical protein GCM10010917_33320 [Paenibacillus physcomitrellae]